MSTNDPSSSLLLLLLLFFSLLLKPASTCTRALFVLSLSLFPFFSLFPLQPGRNAAADTHSLFPSLFQSLANTP